MALNAGARLKHKIREKVMDLADDASIPGVSQVAVGPITEALTKEIVPQVLFQTNQEGFFRSWVNNGSLLAIIGGLYTVGYTVYQTGDLPPPEQVIGAASAVIGGLGGLFGRNVATRPIGQ